MKLKFFLPVGCVLVAAANTYAGVITFENAPVNKDLGTFYQGITFGANEQVVLAPSADFPTKSGTHELFGTSLNNDTILWQFLAPQSTFSFSYSSLFGFTGVAYDKSGTIVANFSGAADAGTSQTITVTDPGICTVILTDNNAVGQDITVDNLTAAGVNGLARPVNAPDATSTLGLFTVAGVALLALRRKVAVQQ